MTLEPEQSDLELELVLDTSFIIGLLRLMSVETSDTCVKIYELSKKLGFKLTVLKITIEETQNTLNKLVSIFKRDIVNKKSNPESILAACERNGIPQNELARISSRVENQLKTKYGINIIEDDSHYRMLANTKYIDTLKFLKEKRYQNKEATALHDTVCQAYVQEMRQGPVFDFLNSRAWFVIGSALNIHRIKRKYSLPAHINSAALVNILWLSNPSARNNLNLNDFTEIGITKMISSILDNFLPTAQVMKKFEKNVVSLTNQNIDLTDCVVIATKLAQKEVFEDFSAVIEKNANNKEKIIKEINKKANDLKQKTELAEKIFREEINKSTEKINKSTKELLNNYISQINEEKIKKEKAELERTRLEKELNEIKQTFVSEKSMNDFKKWQLVGVISIPCVIFLLIFIILLFSFSGEDWNIASKLMDWVDGLSDSRRDAFQIIISALIAITQFLLISIIWNRLISKDSKRKKLHDLIEYYSKEVK